MKMRSFLLGIMALAIMGATSCKKDDDDDDDDDNTTNPTQTRLKSMSTEAFGESNTVTYSYNSAGQVEKVVEASTTESIVMLYTWANGKVVETMMYDDVAMTNAVEKRLYAYNGTELDVITSVQMMSFDTSFYYHTYTNGKLTKVASKVYFTTDITETEYFWTGDNITLEKEWLITAKKSTPTLEDEIGYSYDTKTNPGHALNLPNNDAMLLSANNVNLLDFKGNTGTSMGTMAITYVYNANNLPISGTLSGTIMGIPLTGTMSYTYE